MQFGLAQDARRAGGAAWAMERLAHGLALGAAGDDRDQPVGAQQARDGQRHGRPRHVGERRKAVVVDLLLPADLVEFHHLDVQRIVEIGDRRIVEGDDGR